MHLSSASQQESSGECKPAPTYSAKSGIADCCALRFWSSDFEKAEALQCYSVQTTFYLKCLPAGKELLPLLEHLHLAAERKCRVAADCSWERIVKPAATSKGLGLTTAISRSGSRGLLFAWGFMNLVGLRTVDFGSVDTDED